jgi:hypothetical protein
MGNKVIELKVSESLDRKKVLQAYLSKNHDAGTRSSKKLGNGAYI